MRFKLLNAKEESNFLNMSLFHKTRIRQSMQTKNKKLYVAVN